MDCCTIKYARLQILQMISVFRLRYVGPGEGESWHCIASWKWTMTMLCMSMARKVWRSRWFIWIHSKSVTWIEIEHIVPLYIEIRLRWHIYNADSSDNKFYCWIMLLRTRCFVNDVSCARILLTLFYESVRIILFEWTASLKLIVVFKNELL